METSRELAKGRVSRHTFIGRTLIFTGAVAVGGNVVLDSADAASFAGVASGGVISTFAGGGSLGDGKAATAARLSTPLGTCVDAAGNIYIADTYFHCIRKVDAHTGIISTVAGVGVCGFSGDGRPAIQARMTLPYYVVCDAGGNLYVADNGNSRVRRIDHATGIITTFVGTGRANYNGDGIPAQQASVAAPRGVAMDRAGNLYIVDTINNRVRIVNMGTQALTVYPSGASPIVVQPGFIATVAGNGVAGTSGDSGVATNASLFTPATVAFDSKGNLYIGSENDPRVRMVDAGTGIITTVAGSGVRGLGGDGGPALAARFLSPTELALDSADNLYIVDEASPRIRRVDAQTKIISTIAGGYVTAFTGDGGPATKALLNQPMGVTFDQQDNLYIADYNNARVRRVNAHTGIITTVAGSSQVGDMGRATAAVIVEPAGTAFDAAGNLFISDQGDNRIRVVGVHGLIATVAGTGASGYSNDGGPSIRARLNVPCDVKVDPAGNLYIADLGNYRVRRVDAASGIITTIAGSGLFGFSGDNGPATKAALSVPRGIALDPKGNLYIADLFNLRIRFVNLGSLPATLYGGSPNALSVQPGQIITVVGTGAKGSGGDNGPGVDATVNFPRGVAMDTLGNLYVVEGGTGLAPDSRVRKVDVTTGIITTVAGTVTAGYNGDDIPATSAMLNGPRGVAVDPVGNLFIADTLNSRVRRVDAQSGIITTVAGTGIPGFSGEGSSPTAASMFYPRYVSLDHAGNLYISDAGNSRIRRVTFS